MLIFLVNNAVNVYKIIINYEMVGVNPFFCFFSDKTSQISHQLTQPSFSYFVNQYFSSTKALLMNASAPHIE